MQNDEIPISNGIIASTPKARENEVSPVPVLVVCGRTIVHGRVLQPIHL